MFKESKILVQNKNANYAIYLWISAVILVVVRNLIPPYLDDTTVFILLFIDFFGFLAVMFAIFYSYLGIEEKFKERKKNKRIVKKRD